MITDILKIIIFGIFLYFWSFLWCITLDGLNNRYLTYSDAVFGFIFGVLMGILLVLW
jgi:hypothetical protein